jgi:hypothetical protein
MSDFKPGLEGVIAFESEIAEPDKEGGALRYRGVDIEDLIGQVSFTNVWALLVDGAFLAYAMYITGATQSPLRFLIYLHLVAVSLLASYRTGLKVALWHSLLLFVVLYGQAAMLVPPVDVVPGRAIDFDRMPVLNVTSFWLFALATSAFRFADAAPPTGRTVSGSRSARD